MSVVRWKAASAALALGALALALTGCGGGKIEEPEFEVVPPPPPIVARVTGAWRGEFKNGGGTVGGDDGPPLGPVSLTVGADGALVGTVRDAARGQDGAFTGTLRDFTEEGVYFVDTRLPGGFLENGVLAFPGRSYTVLGTFTLQADGRLTGLLELRGNPAFIAVELTRQ